MKNTRDSDLSDRRSAAAEAKSALLQNYHAAKEAAEPTRLALQAKRLAVAEAREERRAVRERAKLDEQERVDAEAAERRAAADAEARAEVRSTRVRKLKKTASLVSLRMRLPGKPNVTGATPLVRREKGSGILSFPA